ncbi:GGDEF domain-containing protein [Agromyces allii]|uniref:GGDEF domain-containing protein n=1 Tax=Agromyces allii TaxID=393607 RepID=A0ABN2R1J8_9MICO|nr:diguanylate cyclase [Agromyces allii]
MTTIDPYTMQLAVITVTIVAAVMFILDTVLRTADAAGRVWTVAFLSGILASLSYATWIVSPEAWWAVAIGNGAVVLSPALLWSGARAYNGRRELAWVALVAAGAAVVAVVAQGADGGDWAGAIVMFSLIALFAALGAWETLRTPMRVHWAARGLTVIFVVVTVYYATRAAAFVVLGPDDPWFRAALGTQAAGFVLISLMVVAVVSLVVLQGERVPRTSNRRDTVPSYAPDAVLNDASFREIVEDWLERANYHDEQLVFLRIEVDELDALNTAFGRSVGNQLLTEFTEVVRRHGSPHSDIGHDGRGSLVLVAPFARLDLAVDDAEAVQRGLREHRIEAAQGLRLSASIGLAGTDRFGYDFDGLMAAARDAAASARAKGGGVVAVAD